MEKLKSFFIKKRKVLLICLVSFCLIILIFTYFLMNTKKEVSLDTKVAEKLTSGEVSTKPITTEEKQEKEEYIYVDVKGEVKSPGVYKLNKGSRVIDAITISGGLTKSAYTLYINLSKVLKDESVIIVNNKSEIKRILEEKNIKEIKINDTTSVSVKESEVITNDVNGTLDESTKQDETNIDNTNNEKNIDTNTKDMNTTVNINTASISELTSINGIGESKAKLIIDYRNTNGLFKDIEEVKNVTGIGEKLYDKIKAYITVK